MDERAAAIRFDDVYFTYPHGGAFSLELAELSLAAGMCAAVCGPNGGGKTTLGKLAAGLLRPSRGRVLLSGDDVAGWPLGRIGARVGYLFQEPSRQIFAPTVLEDVAFPLELKGMEPARARELALASLERLEMAEMAEATTFTLSRGEKQRLALASILASEPGFLVLDEPTTGLDPRRKAILGGIMARLIGQGVGILLISHDRAFVGEHASVVRYMANGRLVDA